MGNVLVVGPSWVGDMVMAQSLFKALKQEQPACQIDVLAPMHSAPLLARMPEVDTHIPLLIAHGELKLLTRRRLAKQLRHARYDQAIILPNSFKSALIPYWARIPKRTAWQGEYRYGVVNDMFHLNKQHMPRLVQRYIALGQKSPPTAEAERLLHPKLYIDNSQRVAICNRLQLQHAGPILALCPGAEYGPAKRWPAEHFAAVAQEKLAQGYAVWLLGSRKEASVAAEIQRRCGGRCHNLTGQTTLSEAIDLLSGVTAVVTNDTGLMHIAASLDKPMVVLYGSTSAQFTPPLSDKVKILSLSLNCSPCFQRTCPLTHLNCLRQLLPTRVIAALDALGQ